MFWLLIVAQLSLPQLVSGGVSAADAPVDLIAPNRPQTMRFALTVSPDGRVQTCEIEEKSGNARLDTYTCSLVLRRARFEAAKSVDGSATHGIVRQTFNWQVGADVPPRAQLVSDLYLTVSNLPAGVQSPIDVELEFAVSATGRVSNCEAANTTSPAALVEIGCEQLLKGFRPPPAFNAEGVAVPSVQGASVLFTKD